MKKFIILFCLGIFLFHFFQIIYAQRALFTQKYDAAYLKDHFEHSQWVLPLSKRIIGDDELYPHIGYNLINGGSIAGFNSETPPLGKYLIGFSIKIFGNPFCLSIFFGLGSLILFYFIGEKFLGNKFDSLFAASVLFLDPLFFSQFWQSTLDIYQLFFLLAHLLFFILLLGPRGNSGKKHILYASISGIFLGFFAQVKFPILLLLILPLELFFFVSKRRWREYFLYLICIILAVLISNAKFFIDGGSIIDFIRFQKYVASFYLKSQLTLHAIAVWQTLFMGKFPGIATGSLINIYEWWILWPITTLIGVSMAIFSLLSKNISSLSRGFAVFLLASLLIFTAIPIYPRYLVLILPFVYLFGVSFLQKFLNKRRMFLYFVVLVLGIFNSFFFMLPKPEIFLNDFYYNLSNFYFQDLYQKNIAATKNLDLTRSQFREIAARALEGAQVKKIEIKELEKNISTFASSGDVKIGMTYITQDLGSFYEEKNIRLIKENNEWKLVWDWNIVLKGFKPGYRVETQIISGKRGSIIDSSGVYLAKDAVGYLLSINPDEIDSRMEQTMLEVLSSYGYKEGVYLQNAYLENALPNSIVPIMTLSHEISQKEKGLFLSYPGLSLTPYVARIYANLDPIGLDNTFYSECCTRIYSSYNYHGITGPEEEFDSLLWGYSGGKITFRDSKGSIIRTVFEKGKRDGEDVVLHQ